MPVVFWVLIRHALEVLSWVIIADVVFSYIPSVPRRNPVVVLVRQITDVVTGPIRKLFRPQRMGDAYVDFSPLIVLVLIYAVSRMLP